MAPRFLAACLVFALMIGGAASAPAQGLSGDEQALLPGLDSTTLAPALDLVARLQAVQDRLDRAAALLQPTRIEAAIDAIQQGDATARDFLALFELADAIAAQPAAVRALVHYDDFQAQVAALKAQWDGLANQTRDQIRTALNQYNAILGLVENLKKLRNASQFTRSFLDGEIRAWLAEPRTVAGLTIRIVAPPTASVFAPPRDAASGLQVEVTYQGGVRFTARGLYFDYQPTPPYFAPNLSKIDYKNGVVQSLATNLASQLLGSIPDFGLPIAIGPGGVRLGTDAALGKPPTLEVDVKVSVPGFDSASSGGTLVITPAGKVTIKSIDNIVIPGAYPLGTSGLVVVSGGFGFKPDVKTLTLTANVAPLGAEATFLLQITANFDLPPDPARGLTLAGVLLVGPTHEEVGTVELTITGSKVAGKLTIPGANPPPGLADLLTADFQFTLDKEKLDADGMATIYRVIHLNLNMLLKFGGDGTFRSQGRLDLDGIAADSIVSARYTPGFRTIDLATTLTVEVDLKLFRAQASVAIQASYTRGSPEPNATITARALGVEADISCKLSELSLAKIANALRRETTGMLQNVAAAAGQWAKDKEALLAKWETHWRNELHDQAARLGMDALKTEVTAVDDLLASLVRTGDRADAQLSKLWDRASDDARKFIQNPIGDLKKIGLGLDAEYVWLDQARDQVADIVAHVKDVQKPEDVVAVLGAVFGTPGKPSSIPFPGLKNGIPIPPLPTLPGGGSIPIPGGGSIPIPGGGSIPIPGGGSIPVPGLPHVHLGHVLALSGGGFRDATIRSLSASAIEASRQNDLPADQQATLVQGARLLEADVALNQAFAGMITAANQLRAIRTTGGPGDLASLAVQGANAIVSLEGTTGATLGVILRLDATQVTDPRSAGAVGKRAASKVVAGRVEFTALPSLGGTGTPTARIVVDDPTVVVDPTSGASHPDQDLIAALGPLAAAPALRHELQRLVETSFPAFHLEGTQRFVEKKLAVRNPTDQPVTVHVQVRTRSVTPNGYQWSWLPGDPGGSGAYTFVVPARAVDPFPLQVDAGGHADDSGGNQAAVQGSRARIWVESASGERWNDDRERDVWLVAVDPSLGGERAYDAAEPTTFVYTVASRLTPPPTHVTLFQTPDAWVEHEGLAPPVSSLAQAAGSVDAVAASLVVQTRREGRYAPPPTWTATTADPTRYPALGDAAGSDPRAPAGSGRVVTLAVPGAGGAVSGVRFAYHQGATPWNLLYQVDLDSPGRSLEGRAFLRNDSTTTWRDVALTLRAGGPASSPAEGEPRAFELGQVTLDRQQSLLVPLPPSEIGATVEDTLIYNPAIESRHPTRGLAAYNASGRPLPAGSVTLFSGRNFLATLPLPVLPPSAPNRPRDHPGLIRYPGTIDRSLTITDLGLVRDVVYRGHEICAGSLSYSAARREVAYCVEHTGRLEHMVFRRAAEPSWEEAIEAITVGDRPSPQVVLVKQAGTGLPMLTFDLKGGDLPTLRTLRFAAGDRVGVAVTAVLVRRDRIESLAAKRRQEVAEMADTSITDLQLMAVTREVDEILGDPALCSGRCRLLPEGAPPPAR